MKNEKTVLIITSHYPPNMGGVESHLHALVHTLRKYHWKVMVSTYKPLASKKSAPFYKNEDGVVVYRLPWLAFNIVHKLSKYPLFEFLYLFPGLLLISIIAVIKNYREISVVHCQGLVPAAVGLFIKYIFRKRVVVSIHNLYFFPKKGAYPRVAKIIFSLMDAILVPTEYSKKEMMSLGIKDQKFVRFNYWIDLKKFKVTGNKLEVKRKLGWKDKFTVLFVGRLIETKGVHELLKATLRLKSGIEVVIAGDGAMRKVVEKYSAKIKNLTYLGRIENESLPKYYSASDIVIVPSLVDEGFGFVVMEAAACGTPVLAANKGGLSEAVDKSFGILIPPKSTEIVRSINSLYENKNKIIQLTNASRKYALSYFSDRNVSKIISSYESKD